MPCSNRADACTGVRADPRVVRARRPRIRCSSCAGPRPPPVDGEPQREFRADSEAALNADIAAMFVDQDRVADGETLTGAPTYLFGGEEGIEKFGEIFRRNAAAVVANSDHCHIACKRRAYSDFAAVQV